MRVFGLTTPKKRRGNGVVAAHAVEETAGGEMRARAGADRRDQQREVDDAEHDGPPARPATYTNAVSTSG